MPTYQYMAKNELTWTTTEAAACEREGDVITLVDMRDVDGTPIGCRTVAVHDVVELLELPP
jgi:hypothetical protein